MCLGGGGGGDGGGGGGGGAVCGLGGGAARLTACGLALCFGRGWRASPASPPPSSWRRWSSGDDSISSSKWTRQLGLGQPFFSPCDADDAPPAEAGETVAEEPKPLEGGEPLGCSARGARWPWPPRLRAVEEEALDCSAKRREGVRRREKSMEGEGRRRKLLTCRCGRGLRDDAQQLTRGGHGALGAARCLSSAARCLCAWREVWQATTGR